MPKKKGAKTAAKTTDDDNLDALLSEFGVSDPKTKEAPEQESSVPETNTEGGDNGGSGDEGNDDGGQDESGKPMTAAEKRKAKQKAKKKAKKKGGEDDKPKPVSAAAKLVLEKQRLQREEEERIRKLQEEEDRKIKEEEDRIAAEAKRKEDIRLAKKAKEQAKKEKAKADGTYMTKAQKEKAKKAEAARKLLVEKGMVSGGPKDSGDAPQKKKRVVYGKKKKPQTKAPAPAPEPENKVPEPVPEPPKVEAEPPKVEELPKVEEPPKERKVEESKVEPPQEPAVSDDDDESDDGSFDWENDNVDLDQIVKMNVEKKERKAQKDVIVDKAAEEEKRAKEELAKKGKELRQRQEENANREQLVLEQAEAERQKIEQARIEREQRELEALKSRSKDKLRCPICCVLGHVDVGKTKLLDKIRSTSVQDGEAGGITQQIGATHFPREDIMRKTKAVMRDGLEYLIPGLLVVDTPGHESFTNLRSRGSSLCDIAILVVDITHGLEPQTLESIQLLRSRKTPFIVALNKVDRCYAWDAIPDGAIQESLLKQKDTVKLEFDDRVSQAKLAFAEQGLNSELYWENQDLGRTVSLVPTSAHTGEGIPDMLMLLVQLTQTRMSTSLMFKTVVECTILEVKVEPGLGATIDCVLVNGILNEGDKIVVCGMKGPIVTTIRALLTPPPMKEIRLKSEYVHNKTIEAAIGVKVSAQNLDDAIAGTSLYVVGEQDDEDELKEEVMKDYDSIMKGLETSNRGCYVQASSLGSLEALLEFLKTQDPPIPVGGVNIGPIHKKDVIKASIMLEHQKEYATILAFDVKVDQLAKEEAANMGVRIFEADIIYHLFDQFTAYLEDIKRKKREEMANLLVYPAIVKIIPECIFNKRDPIVLGVEIVEGFLKKGTPLCVPQNGNFLIGRVVSIEKDKKDVEVAKRGQSVAIKIEADEPNIAFGRHFDLQYPLYSLLTRASIDALKEMCKEELTREEWMLVKKMKGPLGIDGPGAPPSS